MSRLQHAPAGGVVVIWRRTVVAADCTHHELDGRALYIDRFHEVLSFHEPGLAAVRRGEEAWHVDERARPAYSRRFRSTFGFYEGLAAVVAQDGWLHINPDGTDLYTDRYAWCGNYQQARCAVRARDGAYFHLRHDGSPSYAARWRYVGDFREGFAVAQADDGLSTHIDRHGDMLHGRWFRDLDVFHKSSAPARDDEGWLHVDRRGVALYARRFTMVEPFYNGQARVELEDGARAVIDRSGATVVVLWNPASGSRS